MTARTSFARLLTLGTNAKLYKNRKLLNARRRHFEILESRQMLAIAAGNIVVQQVDTGNATTSVTLSATQATPDFGFTAAQASTSRGDYAIRIGTDPADDVANGVLMTSIRENGRTNDGDTLAGVRYGISSVSTSGGGWRVATNDSAVANTELNINAAAAYFPVADFPLQGTVAVTATPPATLSLPGVNPQTDGVLLVNAESADSRYAQALPLDATTWNVWHHDGAVNGGTYSAGNVRYVYLPYSTPTSTAILGRVFSNNPNTGQPTITSGQAGNGATITRTGTGQYTFSIAGQSPSSGVLLLSVENSGNNNDNIISYQASGNSWNIEVRDQPASPPPLQDLDSTSAPMFTFVFIPTVTGAVPPTAVNDTVTINQDTPIPISVLANDSDSNGDAISIVSATQPANGTAVINANGTITFTPTTGFSGNTSFTYTIQDAPNTGTATATVNVTVRPNTAPVAVNDTASIERNTPTVIAVLGNDSDINGGPLTVTAATGAANGQLSVVNGVITYTPNNNYTGPDSFTYTVRDDTNLTSTGTVNLTVAVTTSFQQGVNGYAGTSDTYIRIDPANAAAVDANEGAAQDALFDNAAPVSQALLRFDNIFGAAGGEVPNNATVVSATLRLRITNEGNGAAFHRMLQTWNEDVITWNTAVDGIQRDGTEAVATADFTAGNLLQPATVNTWVNFDVTASLAAWLANPNSNFGWAIFDTGDDGVRFATSENTTADFQPRLTVVYTAPNNNQPPVNGLPGALSVNEDTPLVFSGANTISIGDPDAASANVTTTLSIPSGRGSLAVEATAVAGLTVTGNGSTSLTLTGPVATINAKLATLIYVPVANINGLTNLTIVTNDQGNTGAGGALSDTDVLAITVTPINDVPSFGLSSNLLTPPFNGGAQSVPGFATNISAGPADEVGQSLTFNVVVGTTTGGLTFSSAPTITSGGVLSYTVATGSSGSAQINVTLQDGGSSVAPNVNTSAVQSFTITVPASNQAPVNTVPATVAPSEDIRFNFTGAAAISISDADAGSANVQTTVSVPAGAGTLRVDATAVPGLSITGVDTNSIQLSGPIAAINAKLATLSYLSASNASGTTTLTVVTNDNGATGPDGPKSDTDTVTINIGAVNDAPTFTIAGNPPAANFNGGLQTLTAFATNISVGPADESQTASFSLVVGPTTGGLTFATAPTIDAAGTLTYAAAAGSSGTAQVTVTLQDSGSGVAPNVNASSQTFTITVSSIVINQPPVNTAPANVTANEDIAFAFSGANVISISDSDAGAANVQTTVSVPVGQGTLSVSGAAVAGLVVTVNGPNSITLAGPVSAINAKLATLMYQSAANANGSTTLTIVTNDNGATGQDGAKSDTDTVSITISPVNDAPTFNAISNPPSSLTGSGLQTVANFATGMSAGPADEVQSLTFVVTPTGTTGGLTFTTAPSINAANGALTYQAAPGAIGTATFSVVLQDNGSSVSPNVNVSVPRTFTINVVGTAPSIIGPEIAIRQTPTSFTFETLNPLAADGDEITFNIDWDGDGDVDEKADGIFDNGKASVDVQHVFAVATPDGQPIEVGVFTTDANGDSEVSTHLVEVDIYGLVTNDEGLDDLVFGGTHFADRIVVSMLYNGAIQIRNNSIFYKIPAELGEVTGRIVIWAGDGNDTVSIAGRVPYDTELHGGRGNDYLAGGAYNDILHGDDGNDRLLGGRGINAYYGGEGNDTISGGIEADTMFGGGGRDVLNGSVGDDIMDGGDGNDTLVGSDGNDILFGGLGNDVLRGDRGDDVILGGGSNDSIQGGVGRDILVGGTGADFIYGGSDDDILVGGEVDLGNGDDAFDLDVETLQLMMADWLAPLPMKSNNGPSRSDDLSDRLNEGSIENDFARDTLYGQADDDWFLTYSNDIVIDIGTNNLRTILA